MSKPPGKIKKDAKSAAGRNAQPDQWTLETFEGHPELRKAGDKPGTGVTADWKSLRLPDGAASLRNQPLGRAVGKDIRTAVDTTAGLGYDTYAMALLGIEVWAYERDAKVFALLESQYSQAQKDPALVRAAAKIHIKHGNAIKLLPKMGERPDLILLDPMFGGERGAAKPSKAMQALAAVAGSDNDSDELFEIAMACAEKRVIVKRSRLAPPLAGRAPDWQIKGKLLRFDVYRRGAE
ncbi:MAG: class I SAM-dependent methyltransferase [Planctomycetes bacterium]|nr:class I SAM-dependent methyltransferase [Planctomycetota bacterium]